MIKDIDIQIKVNGYNKRFLEKFSEKPIFTGEILVINQRSLSSNSTLEVECACDQCGRTHARRRRDITTESTYCSMECRKIGVGKRLDKTGITKERIKKNFLQRIHDGKSILYNDLKREDSSLLYGVEKRFGSISKICNEIGISEEKMISEYGFTNNINKRTLSEEEMYERLIHLKSISRLTTSAMRTEFEDLRLEISLKKVFGSTEEALTYFELERDIVSSSKLIEGGMTFQHLFKQVLDALDIEHIYNRKIHNIVPDFRLVDSNVWIDTKLSSWTSSIEDTIKLYTPHCKKLVIVYLRGKNREKLASEKVEFTNIDSYLPHLVNVGRSDLIEKIESLKLHF